MESDSGLAVLGGGTGTELRDRAKMMPSPNQHVVVRYCGNVQGVGFRMTVIRLAAGLAIAGTVRNESDGSVWLDAEGPMPDVQELLKRIATAMSEHIDDNEVEQRPLTRNRDRISIAY